MTECKKIKLMAKDSEDLQIISAILQDAIVPVMDMKYEKAERRFVMVANRFCWEKAVREKKRCSETGDKPCYERINAAIRISGVDAAQMLGFDLTKRNQMLGLLAIVQQGSDLVLTFADNKGLKLSVKDWALQIEDVGESWPTPNAPHHDCNGPDFPL
jgi:hypothetical protein